MIGPEDDILEAIADRIRSLLIALEEDKRSLGSVPRDLIGFETMSESSRVGSRALLKTVEQLEDQMMRLFRTILKARDVDLKGMYARDVANHMEQIEIVVDVEEWMQVVKLRNRLVHDYPLTSDARFAKLTEATTAADILRAVALRALTYVDGRSPA